MIPVRRYRALGRRLEESWWGLIFRDMDTEPTEFAGGLLKILVGAWLLVPFDTFHSSPTFAALTVLPEWAWGAALAWLGTWHLVALRRGGRTQRRDACTVGWIVWFSFATLFVYTNPPALGFLPVLVIGLGQLWASIRLGEPESPRP